MNCQKGSSLLKNMIRMSWKELSEHLSECSVCRLSLSEAYIAYVKKEKEPILDSFPPYRPKITKDRFLGDWVIRLSWKKERAECYLESLKNKMSKDSIKILAIILIRDLFRYLKDTLEERETPFPGKEIRSLKEMLSIQEAEIFFGFTDESTEKLIRKTETDEDSQQLKSNGIISKNSRTTYYLKNIIDKMDEEEVKSSTIEIVNGLIGIIISDRPSDNFDRYIALISVIKRLDKKFSPEEMEIFFSLDKDSAFQAIDTHLSLKKEKRN